MPPTDQTLLLQHHAGDKAAFAQLASRHVDWIYSAALRRTKNPQLAEDVTQGVFLALATSRRALSAKVLAAWLFGVLRFTAAKAIRSESRRRRRETIAAQLHQEAQTMTPQTDWQSIAPHLDDAIASLRAADRQAILLRFYQQLSFTDVATALQISEEAARKRVTRAVAKLRDHFAAAGTPLSADALAAMILHDCVRTAPAHLSSATASSAATNLFRAWLGHIRLRIAAQLSCVVASLTLVATVAIILPQPPTAQRASAQSNPATQPIASSTPVDSATRPSNLTFDQVLARIQQTEHAFQNVHVKNFQTTTETRKGNQGPWTPSPVLWAGSVWLGADPNGSERLYFADEVLPWVDGAAPWVEEADDISWDGKQSIELRLASGPRGKMFRTAIAFIEKQESMELGKGTREITGLGFTAQYYVPYPLSQTLQQYDKRSFSTEIYQQTVNGFDTIRLQYSYHKDASFSSVISYWFAPDRGFAYVREESTITRPDRVIYESKDVLEFKQVAPNLWFPSRVITIRDTDNTGDYTRYTYHADQITVNDPHFDPAIFHPPIPTAWFVSDLTGPVRRNYFSMPDGSQLETHPGTGTGIPEIKPATSTRPDGDPPPITQTPNAAW